MAPGDPGSMPRDAVVQVPPSALSVVCGPPPGGRGGGLP
ncbi:hypothetical protein CKAH01_01869 [Colletotrichum kahawae]|uniref:Uncharacterized protein n=1 Tax=Colletotrichum kahawae TaxID=34407 RepID=A0AAD9Y4J6_COLKA|nr:hypothetical protein CKAH01_01869 [Colletotrichum kahawae]